MTKIEIKSLKGNKKNLPNGWQWVKLGDICEFVGGMQPPKYVFKYEPLPSYVRLVQIQDFRRSDVAVYIPAEEAKRTFDESDVMIGRYGPPLFQILRGLSGAYNVALIKTVPKVNLLKDYLYYLLQEPSIQNAVIAQSQRSAGQTGVQKEFLERLVVPLPPLEEPHRIAAILNEKMGAVERSRQATLAQLEAAKALPSAYLRAVFNSTEAQKWSKKRIGDFAETCSGTTPSRERQDYYIGTIPWIKTGELQDGIIEHSEEHISETALRETSLKLLPASSLLIAMYGQGKTRGRTGLLSKPSTTNQACFAILPNPNEFDSKYLQLWFRYSYFRLRSNSEGRGNTFRLRIKQY